MSLKKKGGEPVVVLQSGGLDSAALLARTRKETENVHALHIVTDERQQSALRAAELTASHLDVPLSVLDLSSLSSSFSGSKFGIVQPMPNPGRHVLSLGSLIVFGVASAWAHQYGCNRLQVGLTKLDADDSPEYEPEFLERYAKTVATVTDDFSLQAPFIEYEKSDVAEIAAEIDGLVPLTWSCTLVDRETHCGVCQGCKSRRQAFEKADVYDPTEYEHDW